MKKQTEHPYEAATHTRGTYPVKDVKWNGAANAYLGLIKDPIWSTEKRPWTTASWKKNGKSVNQLRTDCDLVLDPAPTKR